jgi:hypothetical protein
LIVAKAPTPTNPPSANGRYSVQLSKAFKRRGFTYKPGLDITVSEAVLGEMQAEGVVANVVAAD